MFNKDSNFEVEKFSSAILSNTLESSIYLNKTVASGIPLSIADMNKSIIKSMILYKIFPRKTWENAKKSKKLSSQNSERLLRVLRMAEKAKQAFGNEAGLLWIERPTSVFDSKAPIEMLNNESGSRAVELFLGRAMHGFNA